MYALYALCVCWVHARVRARFQEESEPAEYVEQLAEQMLPSCRYDDLHILSGPYVMEDWDPELIEVTHGVPSF